MHAAWKTEVWRQFGAAIDMLGNALGACPDELWQARLWREGSHESEFSQFWSVGYHALFWLDLYLSGAGEGFAPPSPFGLEELDPAGALPERPYTKEQLKRYLDHGRERCRATMEALTDEASGRVCSFPWGRVAGRSGPDRVTR